MIIGRLIFLRRLFHYLCHLPIALLFLSPVAAQAAALPGDPALLEAIGTTPVAYSEEKTLFSYTVRPGDTLWDIARWVLKDPFQWPEMLKYNYFENPDLIYPGDRLIVPSPEVLEKVRQARDVQEIEDIRRETEAGAVIQELAPLPAGAPAGVTPEAESLVRAPLQEPEAAAQPQSDLQIRGRKNISLNYREYKGGTSPNYFSSGYTRQESLYLTLTGQMMNQVKINGEFYQSDQSLENKYSLQLETERMELYLGDFDAVVPDTEFLLTGRSISGGRFSADFETLGGMGLVGAAKGIPRYEKFYGTFTQGPYYLQHAPVVSDSERIRLNKKELTRGTDYTLDYYSGRITFLKQAVDDITLVEAAYESRQTVYPRTLYAARLWAQPWSWLRWGGGLVREEDPENTGRIDLGNGNTLTPIGHWVAGSDISAEIPGYGAFSGEYARSEYQPDRTVREQTKGQAVKAQSKGSLGPVGLAAYYRKTSPGFKRVGSEEQGSDVLNFGGAVDLKTGGPYVLAGEGDYWDAVQNQVHENRVQAAGRAKFFPRGWPLLGYEYFQLRESNDAPAPDTLDHETVKHAALTGVEQDYFSIGFRAEQEKREGQLAGRASAITRGLEATAGSKNLGWLNASGLYAYQEVDEPGNSLAAGSAYRVQKARINGAVTPNDRYALTLANEWVWDEAHGSTRTLDTKMNARPMDEIRLDAKYAWETMQSLIAAAYRGVYTQTASGQLEILPVPVVSLRLAPSLRWTSLADSGRLLNKTRTDVGTCKWAMLPQLAHEGEVKRDLYVLADSTDEDLRFQTEQQSKKGTYALKVAISAAFSGEAAVSYEQFSKSNFNAALSDYDRLCGRERRLRLGLRSSLREILRLDGSYVLTMRDQDGTSAASLTRTAYAITETGRSASAYDLLNTYGSLHTRQDTGTGKATYQWTEVFSSYVEGTYDRNEDQTGGGPVIHTLAPGAGVILRWLVFRAEAGAKWARSWGGIATQQESYQASLNYHPVQMIALQLRGQHGVTRAPASSSSEVTLNCSVQF
ncbi:LysM peptidoglycan-binding domain-containing protein [candidate division FCPU426 bacterium]|nr:LysM peptidoglycan-binding domain-containing protein [candidate division FCPU426 bacterium]